MSVREEHAELIRRYLDALLALDLDALGSTFSDDVVEQFPQSGERLRGRAAITAMLARQPAPPRLLAGPFVTSCSEELALAEAKFAYGGDPWWFVDRFELGGGRIRRMTSYFGEPFEAPAWRRPFVALEPRIDPGRWADDGDGQSVDRGVADRYLRALARHDAATASSCLHPDYRGLYPQSGERFDASGALAIDAAYPGGLPKAHELEIGGGRDEWVVTPANVPLRLSGESDTWFGEALLEYATGERLFTVVVDVFRDGLVWRERSYYCPPFEVPGWRSGLVERIEPAVALD